MRKIISSVSLLMCLSSAAVAMDVRIDNPYIHKIELSKEAKNKIKALRSQNQSLRETIHAQSKNLISSSDAVKDLKRLSSENAMLKRQLQQMELQGNCVFQGDNNQSYDYTSTQGSLEGNKFSKSLLSNMKSRISQLQAENISLQKTKMQLQRENEELLEEVQYLEDENQDLKDDSEALEEALYDERKSAMEDRIKMQQYKEEYARDSHLKSGYSLETCHDNENISRKINLYKSNISYLEAGMELKNKEIDLLKLENQELSAQVNLACEN